MSIHFCNFAVGKGGNSPTSANILNTSYTMTTIQLIGNVATKRATFRQELKTLASEWEQNYIIDYMCLAENSIQITCKFKNGCERRAMLFLDADIMLNYLEQWTEWKTTSISIY